MNLNEEEKQILKKLEESLWIPTTRFDQIYLDQILSPTFFEFGRSGRIYKRDETISAPLQEIKAKLPLSNFAVHSINEEVVLITYVSEVTYEDGETEFGNRSSLWMKTSNGWQLQFHQGTPVAA